MPIQPEVQNCHEREFDKLLCRAWIYQESIGLQRASGRKLTTKRHSSASPEFPLSRSRDAGINQARSSKGGVAALARILVVDDKKLVRRTLCSLLRQETHWRVYEAMSGKAAVSRLLKIKPDVIVMDMFMPEMKGIEAAYQIRGVAPKTRIIFMSGYSTPEDGAHVARLFGDGNFIEKSEAGKELIPTISRMLPEASRAVLRKPS